MASRDRLVLAAWEAGAAADALTRPAALVAALEHRELAEARRMALAARDATLIAWRAQIFGAEVSAVARCPACAVALEYRFVPDAGLAGRATVEHRGRVIALAEPSTDDLCAAMASGDPVGHLRAVALRDVPAEAQQAALAALEAAHGSMAGIELACVDCGHRWRVELDIGALLWRELGAAAGRLMREVATLARAFGWSERAVLALGRPRREAYLALAEG